MDVRKRTKNKRKGCTDGMKKNERERNRGRDTAK